MTSGIWTIFDPIDCTVVAHSPPPLPPHTSFMYLDICSYSGQTIQHSSIGTDGVEILFVRLRKYKYLVLYLDLLEPNYAN